MSTVRVVPASAAPLAFLAGGGETGSGLRSLDWTAHPLGPPEFWPQSLKTIVRVMLDSRYAMWMAWGPQLTFFCNDAYLPTVGLKRDWVLGARSDEVWKEIWPDIGPRIEHVLTSGEATWDEGLLLFLERSGFVEETYHTFSYSPVYDDLSRIAGMLCVVTEVTERVVGERRLRVLRDLASQAMGVDEVASSYRRAVEVLAQYPLDLPFCALYVLDADSKFARRAALSTPMPEEWFPEALPLLPPPSLDRWKLASLCSTEERQSIDDLSQLDPAVTGLSWPGHAKRAVVLPLTSTGQDRLVGFLIAGVSPRRAFDDAYASFLNLVAGQLASGIANAQAYEAERERAEALAEIDRAKTAFFSNVSHEFRTPLTLMLGPIEDMASDPTLPEAARGRVDLLHRNSLRLLKLVNSLLEFSRIEAGRMQATYLPTDLTGLTADLASTFTSAVELAGLQLRVDLQRLPDPVYVDRDMWEKIVLNLLSNAFKYTLQGEIEVTLRGADGHAVLSVRDTGIGIPPQAVPKLFERFYRVEGAEGRTHEGSGIGLALVYELVKLHGGTVTAQSTLKEGTTLVVRIPLGSSHLPPERIGAAHSLQAPVICARQFVEEALRWLPETVGTSKESAPLAMKMTRTPTPRDAHPRAVVHGSRVIVADDNSDMRAYVRELLESRYKVEAVADGQAALEAARREIPDLIVSDVMMPRMDGFALLRTLRADPQLRDVPTILLSARAGEEAVIEGLEAMADDYLVKPFSARELIARVGAQLQLARFRREATAREHMLLSAAPLGMYLVDADLRIRDINPTARPVFGDIPDLVGRHLAEVLTIGWGKEHADQVVGLFRHTLDTGEPYATYELLIAPYGAGEPRYYEWQITRIPLPEERFGVVCYFRDVSDHVWARMALETADRQKNEFLAMLAHELRNPLAPIRNAGEILSRVLPADSAGHSMVAMVKRQVSQLTRLVDDLLDVSRITQGRVELQRRPLEIGSVVSQAIETAEPLFQARQHEVAIVSSYRALYVDGDMARLVQCVVNILTNAAKYTDSGGKIRVETRAEDSEAVIMVTDSGAGISPELLPRVFDLFVQGERTLDRSLGGLGIGLSVAKRLIEMHSGRLTAASAGLGQGATFEIRLPRLERQQEVGGRAEGVRAASKRILIVDDNADAANSLAQVLALDGHVAESVYSASAALERAASFAPEVVLLDLGLPEMDGYEVARRLRQRPEFIGVRIVALTGYGQSEDLRRSREVGFDAHLTKPVDFGELVKVLAGPGSS
jgi:signal transduction histidine kinase/CheY-like chemotaxis protein